MLWRATCVNFFWLTAGGCASYHVGTQSLYAPDVATVYVPMIESGSYRRDLGERLTEAVVKEIELKTPYKVVGTPAADSILSRPAARRLAARLLVRKPVRRPARLGAAYTRKSAGSTAAASRSRRRRMMCVPAGAGQHRATANLIPEVRPIGRLHRSSKPSSGWPSKSSPRWKRRGKGCLR